MGKLTQVLIAVILILGMTTFVMFQKIGSLTKDRDKYKANTSALLSDMKRMQIDSTTTAVDVKTLRLTLDEFKQYRAEDAERIKKLGIKIKDLQAVAKHTIDVNVPLQATIRDTTVIRDTTLVQIRKVEMISPHIQLSGIIENNKLDGNIHLPVTLHQAVWIEPKYRFLWWRWGVKAVHQTISSDNPYVKINYSEYITIQK